MAPIKRRKTTVTLKQKAEILSKLAKGFTPGRLAQDYGIANSTITYIKQHKTEIMDLVSNYFQVMNKKTLHKSEYPVMENKLYEWFLEHQNRSCLVNESLLKAKAKEIFEKTRPNVDAIFNASDGWLDKFKKRRGIKLLAVCGEKLSADSEAVKPFVLKFQKKVAEMELSRDQIYKADESCLFYRMIPRKNLCCFTRKVCSWLGSLQRTYNFLTMR